MTAAQARAEPRKLAFVGVTAWQLVAFLAMVFGMFMAILDIQIVSASLAEIQAGLSASADEIAWVQTSYLIAEVVMIPLSGFLSRLLSTRILFTISAAGFTLASMLCATATSIEQMILYRALQGFIGGGMIPSVFAVAFTLFPASKRGVVSPLIALVATLAPTIGPTVGGYLSNTFSWHWLFLINVGPGILVSIAVFFLVDFDRPDYGLLKRFDFLGLAAMAVFLGSLEYVLEEGPRYDWFDDATIFTLAITAALGAMAAVGDVEGRYEVVWGAPSAARLYLSKNPAGWIEILNLVEASPRDVVIAINAEVADGKDTSWLWDVPFERLAAKRVIATGTRANDLAVRLTYADVSHEVIADLRTALAAGQARDCDVIGNYTAFRDVRKVLDR